MNDELRHESLSTDLFLGLDAASPDNVRYDPWHPDLTFDGGGAEYGEILQAMRKLHDVITASKADPEALARGTQRILEVVEDLAPFRVCAGEGYSGRRLDLPGRGHPLIPPAIITTWETSRIQGHITFSAAHVGGRGAVHGGVIPLLFDEILGRLSNTNQTKPARTAYLRTDYRAVTLPDLPYRFEAQVDREQGRKRFLSAKLLSPDREVTAEAEGLFIALRETQP